MSLTDAELLVVDTDALSFVLKRDPVRGPRYSRHLNGRQIVIPFSVLAELRLWIEERALGVRRRAAITVFVQNSWVKYPDAALCDLWASIVAEANRRGRPIDIHDAWNAAVAIHLEAPLLTHNVRHYVGVPGLYVETEADP
jgi:predicted nucleic acid-binding protein